MLSEFPFANLILSPQFIIYIFLLLLFQSKFFKIPVHKKNHLHAYAYRNSFSSFIYFLFLYFLFDFFFFFLSCRGGIFLFGSNRYSTYFHILNDTGTHTHSFFSVALICMRDFSTSKRAIHTHSANKYKHNLGPRTIENFHDL